MKTTTQKPVGKPHSLNGHHAFYIREEKKLRPEQERENGKVRVLTVLDLFAGAGGFTLGFVQAGFAPVFAVELDKHAAATYEANFGPHCTTDDINNIKVFPPADVIIGGPPCQGFSNLGAHLPNDPRNQLWRHYVRAVAQVRPLVFPEQTHIDPKKRDLQSGRERRNNG